MGKKAKLTYVYYYDHRHQFLRKCSTVGIRPYKHIIMPEKSRSRP